MRNNKLKNPSELEEFGKELFNLLPKNALQKTLEQIESFDGETPEAMLTKMKAKSSKIPQISNEKQLSLQNKFFNAFRSPEYVSQIKIGYKQNINSINKSIEKDYRYSCLINLFKRVDERIEFMCFWFIRPYLDFETNFIESSKSISLIEKITEINTENITDTNKEKRKNYLAEFFREVSEPLYRNYLETIWRLSYLAESEMFPENTPRFGELVKQSANRLKDFPNLVATDMKLLRNSFVHKNFKYDLKADSFVVWDDNTPHIQMSANEIVKIAKDVGLMCLETFPLVAQLYFLRDFCMKSGLLDLYLKNIPSLTSENIFEVSEAEKELSAFGILLIEPTIKFFQAHYSSSNQC